MIDQQLAQKINEIVRKAGKLLEKLSKDPEMRRPQLKEDGSPVTPADLLVSDYLMAELAPLNYLVVSEEEMPQHPPSVDDSYFLVDPVDGTKYFSRGEDEFAICVGLLIKGEPAYGAIYDPSESKLYWAVRGAGAYCDDNPIKHPGSDQALRVFSSGFHKRPEKDLIMEALNIGEVFEKGSALKFCDLALGEKDLYMRFGPISEWDTASAQVILEEAGCVLYEAKTLAPMVYGKANYLSQGVIACSEDQIDKVVSFLKTKSIEIRDSRAIKKNKG